MGKVRSESSVKTRSRVKHNEKPYEKNGRESSRRRREVDSPSSKPPPPSPPHTPVSTNEVSSRRLPPPPESAVVDSFSLIRHYLNVVLDKLYKHEPESIAFRYPVDPEKLEIPDYPQIIKRPMDLSTIRSKLNNSEYIVDPWEIVEDIWLIFENAWLYNPKSSIVYRYCTKLAKIAEAELTPVMLGLGYCCAKSYSFKPQPLHCFGKNLKAKCFVTVGTTYYLYNEKYAVCEPCFSKNENNQMITLYVDDNNNNSYDPDTTLDSGFAPTPPPSPQHELHREISVRKEEFLKKINNELEPEPKVQCFRCQRFFHQICVLHLETETDETNPFLCTLCKGIPSQPFTAVLLPHSELSRFVETHVRRKLVTLMTTDSGPGASSQNPVFIRVTSSIEKEVKVKQKTQAYFVKRGDSSGALAFPYKAKSLCAFQKIDGVDVLFFVMYVQEYDSDCPGPNTGRVYISYLDSVHFFQPKELRTMMYHEIILGYLEYVKTLGFHTAHIWACPPNKGEDYILHAHPPEQKMPCVTRLVGWYKKLLQKGVDDGILLAQHNLWDQVKEGGFKSSANLPYFDGDFWPNWLEDMIEELEKKETERKKENKGQFQRKLKRKSKKGKGSETPPPPLDLEAKMKTAMELFKDKFFVAHLRFDGVPEKIVDPNRMFSSKLMRADDEGRDALLALSKENNYEFSTLRRAKFSTQAILFHLTEEMGDVLSRSRPGPPPPTLTPTSTSASPSRQAVVEVNLLTTSLQKYFAEDYVKKLTHARLCKDDSCLRLDLKCFQAKKLLAHIPNCPDRETCFECQKHTTLCYYHSLTCRQGDTCQVPHCLMMKQNQHRLPTLEPSPPAPPDCEGFVGVSDFPISFPGEDSAFLEPEAVWKLYNLLNHSFKSNEEHQKAIDWLRERPRLVPFFRKLSSLEDGNDVQDEAMDLSYPEREEEGL
ncbi:unnamed protein product [Orchesella dallaii]|uniref:histone acetyltransferase n=1 Tax=Orchesella dallaii TaxID=48710 RepID=A0ABP1PIF1_9HEXA